MSITQNNKQTTLYLLIMLLIASFILSACGGTTDSAVSASPLRQTTDVAQSAAPSGESEAAVVESDQKAAEVDQPIIEQTETINSGNTQDQIADRSEHTLVQDTTVPLTQAEIDALLYMREEEKLARDIYLALYAQWGVPIFQNIATSEQAHMDSVLFLLEQYGLDDPAANLGEGEFSNPLFQDLYEELLGEGNLSLADGLTVGAKIEELDIVDLQERLAETENEAVIQVFNNLLSGSENHLRAYVSLLERQTGTEYQPLYLDQNAFGAIMNAASGRGNGQGGNGQGGSGQGGNGQGGNGNGGNGQGTGTNQGNGGRGNGRGQNNNA